MMSRRMKDSLDRHITGNWGEDQFRGADYKDHSSCETCPEEKWETCKEPCVLVVIKEASEEK